MHLGTLRVHDLRNLAQVELPLGPHATVIVGENGQGKTNLLEALYFLATLKPLRATRLAELVRFGTAGARVEGDFTLGGARRVIAVAIEKGERQAYVDGKPAANLEDYFGGVSVVAFTPDDLALVKEGPDARRRFIDRAVFNRFPAYLAESRSYGRALRSRNRLLREHAAPSLVSAFDGPLALAGARLWTRRRTVLAELAPRATKAFSEISLVEGERANANAPGAMLKVGYRVAAVGSLGDKSEAELVKVLQEALIERLPRDSERGFTSVGPHADDLELLHKERVARAYASQGQQRAIVLALKLGEIDNLSETLGRPPLLLLDDVSSELDPQKNAHLMQTLRNRVGQALLTTTDARLVSDAAGPDASYFSIRAGVLSKGLGDSPTK
jgi:DNA replication and repair protein RecF